MQIQFIGPSYVAYSLNIDAQRSINLYLEKKETQDAKGQPVEEFSLLGTPGLTTFCQLPTFPVRGQWVALDRLFVVSGNTLYEVFSNAVYKAIGTLLTNSYFVGMADNGLQLCVVDGANEYIYDFSTASSGSGALITITTTAGAVTGASLGSGGGSGYPASATFNLLVTGGGGNFGSVNVTTNAAGVVAAVNSVVYGGGSGYSDTSNCATSINMFFVNPAGEFFAGANTVSFCDGYFLLPQPLTNKYYLSGLYDGTSISGLDFAEKEGASDFIRNIIVDHRQPYIFGEFTTEPWYDSGSAAFPFAPIQGIFIETGLVATFAASKMDNTIIFLGKDRNGEGIVYRMQGYTPIRISTHAIELMINAWGDLQPASSYSYTDIGHSFYVLSHPNASTNLVYDSSTQQWHERAWADPTTGELTRHRAATYSNAFSQHMMGDWETGTLYTSDPTDYTDAGNPIHRIRISPHGSNDLERVFYSYFQVDMETGVGLDGNGLAQNPQIVMQYSNDGGHTWSYERTKSVGPIGKTKRRAFWNKCGQGRDRVWKIKISDPVKVVLIGAKVKAGSQ